MSELETAAGWYAWFKRRGGRDLRGVLLHEWDPIGVAGIPEAEDEYDIYLAPIADELRRGVSEGVLAGVLASIRTDRMALPANPDRDHAASRALIAWYKAERPLRR